VTVYTNPPLGATRAPQHTRYAIFPKESKEIRSDVRAP
jgi:hypothetical protein